MKRAEVQLYTLIAAMVLFWSGNYIVGKIALREFPPLLLVGLRLAFAGLFMLPVYWWEGRTVEGRWTRQDLPALLAVGVLGLALNQVFFVAGLSRTSVAHSALLVGMSPVVVLLLASLCGMERLTLRKAAGMLIALAGVAILKAFEEAGHGPTWTGDILILCNVLAFAGFTVFGKQITKRHTTITVNTFGYVGGALAMLPAMAWEGRNFSFTAVSAGGWISMLYMALFPSVIAYLIYYYVLGRIPASRASAFTYLQPVIAMLLGVVILGEHLTSAIVAGGIVIFAGVWLTERG